MIKTRTHTHTHTLTHTHTQAAVEDEAKTTNTPYLLQYPGLFLLPPWFAMYLFVCAVTWKLAARQDKAVAESAKHCQNGRCPWVMGAADPDYRTEQDVARIRIAFLVAAACFVMVIVMQVASLVFQISSKKRVISSLIMYINVVGLTTYVVQLNGWMAPVRDFNGRDVQIERYIEWMSTTPIILFVIAASGNAIHSGIVRCWRSTLTMMAWDELMLVLGLLHSILADSYAGWSCFWISCFAGLMVFRGVRKEVQHSVRDAVTTYEITSMRGLEYPLYMLWSTYPVIHYAYYSGALDWLQYEFAMTFVDVVTKSVYGITMLTGNLCLMDVVQVWLHCMQAPMQSHVRVRCAH